MAISQSRRIQITSYLLLAGICIISQAFMMRPFVRKSNDEVIKPVYNGELAIYFKAPELPLEYCNTIPKKEVKKNKRIKTKVKAIAIIPLMLNPVIGATGKSIISFFGDARDNGRRHEGIDIVAPKGTIIVAPSEGEITDVSYNSLGGKVIWMKDLKQKRQYYFAHLDSQIVVKGMIVKPGDTLGTVGNTGNARRTRAHLHFGVYTKDGRRPVEYIKSREQVMSLLAAN